MMSNAQALRQVNALAVDLLLTGAEIALRFLNTASDSEEDRKNLYEEAFLIYNIILKFLPRVKMSQEQSEALMTRLNVLRTSTLQPQMQCWSMLATRRTNVASAVSQFSETVSGSQDIRRGRKLPLRACFRGCAAVRHASAQRYTPPEIGSCSVTTCG
jgi:hypothetical protein